MALTIKTPGVFIQELAAFPASVVAVETSVPVFIGYTEKAIAGEKTLVNKPTRIASLTEYETYFGKAFRPKFKIEIVDTADGSILIEGKFYRFTYPTNQRFYLYNSMRLFFVNGGVDCYILSLDTYGDKTGGLQHNATKYKDAIDVLKKEQDIPLVVLPDATMVDEVYSDIYKPVLAFCNEVQSTFAIFDLKQHKAGISLENHVQDFRSSIGNENLKHGAAYIPWLNTSIVQRGEVDFENISLTEIGDLVAYLPEPKVKDLMSQQYKLYPELLQVLKSEKASKFTPEQEQKAEEVKSLFHKTLIQLSPAYQSIINQILFQINQLPPCGAIAGIYAQLDNAKGVWNAPANISLNMVNDLCLNISDKQQEGLNVDVVEGKSINCIRTFAGKGNLVWGARTLDGNSNDWRYINVRRTLMMIEQSLKLATQAYVFEPNDANTWVAIKAMSENYLISLWKQGALAGNTPEEAFSVQVGLGVTMTGKDILDGILNVTVMLALIRPAEFIVISFHQQMQKA